MIGLRHELLEVTERLVKEYEAILPAGSVLRCVVRCRDELLLLGLSDGLLEAVDAMARRRLQEHGDRSEAETSVATMPARGGLLIDLAALQPRAASF